MSLNEKISAWFEPKPTVITATSLNSFAGYWRCSTLPEWGWYPLNYDTDEAANARLLEAMPSPMLFKSKQNGNWVCRPDYGIADYSPEHADRKTAIRMAFCKFAGIEENE